MTQDQALAMIRQVIPLLGGIAIGRGWLTPAQVADITTLILQIAGPIMVIGGSVWAFKANSKTSIITSATNMPEVDSKKLEAAISDPNLKDAAKPTS